MKDIKQQIVDIIVRTHRTPFEQADEIINLQSEQLLEVFKDGFNAATESLVVANKVIQQKQLQ